MKQLCIKVYEIQGQESLCDSACKLPLGYSNELVFEFSVESGT